MQLCADREQTDIVGDLSVCLDGLQVDPEVFLSAEANNQSQSLSCSVSHVRFIKLFTSLFVF